jgi:hypothetical protein
VRCVVVCLLHCVGGSRLSRSEAHELAPPPLSAYRDMYTASALRTQDPHTPRQLSSRARPAGAATPAAAAVTAAASRARSQPRARSAPRGALVSAGVPTAVARGSRNPRLEEEGRAITPPARRFAQSPGRRVEERLLAEGEMMCGRPGGRVCVSRLTCSRRARREALILGRASMEPVARRKIMSEDAWCGVYFVFAPRPMLLTAAARQAADLVADGG